LSWKNIWRLTCYQAVSSIESRYLWCKVIKTK